MRKVYRCRWDKKIAGVCGGFGQYFQIDPTMIRFAALCLMLITGIIPLLIAYLIAWAVMPEGPAAYVEIKAPKLYRSKSGRKIAGVLGGIAEVIHVDPTIVRVVFVLVALFTCILPLLIAYIIGIAIIPQRPI